MVIDISQLRCTNNDCRVAETGKCVEGNSLEVCPHYLEAHAVEEDTEEEKPSSEPQPPDNVLLPSGERLEVAEVSILLKGIDTRLVAIIGSHGAGKTSLISGFYELFQSGPIEGINFARSRTLYAFERTCHLARANSQRTVPHTERTARAEFGFYHLGLSSANLDVKLDLIIADRSGEDYRSVIDDVSISSSFFEVHRADTLVILVDGYKIIDPRERHGLKSQTEMILQGLLDGDALSSCKQLALVLTKLDEIEALGANAVKKQALSQFDAIVESVNRRFGSTFPVIQSFKVAASPRTAVLARGFGLSDLLRFWLQSSDTTEQIAYQRPVSRRSIGRIVVLDEEE